MTAKVLVLMRGCPGSGLSTAALAEAGGDPTKVFCPDDYPDPTICNPPICYLQVLPGAVDWNIDRVRTAAQEGVSPIVVDAPNLRQVDALPYLSIAKNQGYDIRIVEPTTPEWLAVKEVMPRVWAGEKVDLMPYAKALAVKSHYDQDLMDPRRVRFLLLRSDPDIDINIKPRYPKIGPIDPAWRTPTVLQLAEAIYETRDFSPLPILADALEEAGCTDPDILAHCRQPGVHARGCWFLDLLLGKE